METQQAKTQLIAHDKEVYDVTFAGNNADIFASVGADGSVRMFDLRALEHSTIIYETTSPLAPKGPTSQPGAPQAAPLLRLAFNKLDANYLSTFHMDSSSVQILDIRVPGIPVSDLRGHKGPVNCMAWSPIGSTEIATGSKYFFVALSVTSTWIPVAHSYSNIFVSIIQATTIRSLSGRSAR